jgi:signal transduction histidine kinase
VASDGSDTEPRPPGKNSTWPGGATGTWAARRESPADSTFDEAQEDRPVARAGAVTPWAGWRLTVMLAFALVGFAALFALVRAVSLTPHVNATWRAADNLGSVEIASSSDPSLQAHIGKPLRGISSGGGVAVETDPITLRRAPRWIVDDGERARQIAQHDRVWAVLESGDVRLEFTDRSAVDLKPAPLGVAGLPIVFWLLSLLAMALYIVTLAVIIGHPIGRNVVYGAMALGQAASLMYIATEMALVSGWPPFLVRWDMPARMGFDLCTAAAMVNAACLHPRRLPGSGWIALGGWAVAFGITLAAAVGWLPDAWWWAQGTVIALGLCAIGLLSWSYRIEPHPFAILLRRFGVVTIATWALLTAALASSGRLPEASVGIADIGSMVWYVFLSSMLLLVPYRTRSQNLLREFSLLAAVCTVATSLDLLFVEVFSFSPFASLTLSLFVSLGVYTGVRQWILNQLRGNSMLTTERMFEQLYRIAREVEASPERTPALLAHLLDELFEPLEISQTDRRPGQTRIAGDGSYMLVPVPLLGPEPAARGAVSIRFAQRGRRLFTIEDARLTDRIVEQLRRAVHFDKAVEQGRSEERMRLAQDLHDDIGARLLTLMYKAQSPEMEDYVRHTLQDLKTLTRGLAASNHRLSHAAAEWKSDLAHRLTAAHVELKWSVLFDDDLVLTVVHWSAFTRILRELVSNVIAHAQAQRVEIDFKLENDRVDLTISDDGVGRDPRTWSHGLGLGGVRKRVKQLGGEVEWREALPRGISCRVVIRDLSSRW